MPRVLVQSVKRALDALDYIAGECVASDGVRLGDIADHLDLKPTTLRNILRTMEACGYVGRTEDRLYRPGQRCARLAFGSASVQALLRVARPAMQELADSTGESLVLTCLAGGTRRVLARHEGGHLVTINARRMDEGDPYSLVTTRVLLAQARPEEVRAFVEECGPPGTAWDGASTPEDVVEAARELRGRKVVEYHPSDEVVALAAPARVPGGMPVALGLFLPASRFSPDRSGLIKEELTYAARSISKELKNYEPEF